MTPCNLIPSSTWLPGACWLISPRHNRPGPISTLTRCYSTDQRPGAPCYIGGTSPTGRIYLLCSHTVLTWAWCYDHHTKHPRPADPLSLAHNSANQGSLLSALTRSQKQSSNCKCVASVMVSYLCRRWKRFTRWKSGTRQAGGSLDDVDKPSIYPPSNYDIMVLWEQDYRPIHEIKSVFNTVHFLPFVFKNQQSIALGRKIRQIPT